MSSTIHPKFKFVYILFFIFISAAVVSEEIFKHLWKAEESLYKKMLPVFPYCECTVFTLFEALSLFRRLFAFHPKVWKIANIGNAPH
jgi:hypothetical protein